MGRGLLGGTVLCLLLALVAHLPVSSSAPAAARLRRQFGASEFRAKLGGHAPVLVAHGMDTWARARGLPAAEVDALAAARLVAASMYGTINGTGEFFTDVLVGGHRFLVQVDTGSVALAVPGRSCKQGSGKPCDHTGDTYDGGDHWVTCSEAVCPVAHCSSADAGCPFLLSYADGSYVRGRQAVDSVQVGQWTVPSMRFGVIEVEADDFIRTTVDGIMGLASQRVDPLNGQSFADALAAASGDGRPDVFAMCTSPIGGSLVMQSDGQELWAAQPQFTPLDSNGLWLPLYGVGVQTIAVGTQAAVPVRTTAVVDSGTTLMLLENSLFAAFRAGVLAEVGTVTGISGQNSLFDGWCYNYPRSVVKSFPDLVIGLSNNVSLVIPATAYLVSVNSQGAPFICLGVMESTYTILGDVALQGYVTIYDRSAGRIGFAPRQSCGSPELEAFGIDGAGNEVSAEAEAEAPVAVAVLSGYPGAVSVKVTYKDLDLPADGVTVRFRVVLPSIAGGSRARAGDSESTTTGSSSSTGTADAGAGSFEWYDPVEGVNYGDTYYATTDSTGIAQAMFVVSGLPNLTMVATVDAVEGGRTITFAVSSHNIASAIVNLVLSFVAVIGCVFVVVVVCGLFIACGVGICCAFSLFKMQRHVDSTMTSSNFDYTSSFVVPEDDAFEVGSL
jgi:hypothetical protein